VIDIVDTTTRDGNQSLWSATGLTTPDILPIAPTIDTIKRLDIADEDRRKIFVGNAERLLNMKLS